MRQDVKKTHKTCPKCTDHLTVDQFYCRREKAPEGRYYEYPDSMCKTCRNRYNADRAVTSKRQAFEYKGGECEDCGLVDHPALFDFHHLDPAKKDFDISLKKGGTLTDTVKAELDKCVLLCVLCHRRRHINGYDSGSQLITLGRPRPVCVRGSGL